MLPQSGGILFVYAFRHVIRFARTFGWCAFFWLVIKIATTRIIPMHINKGKTIMQCLKARIDYAQSPEKSDDGRLISAYACTPETADQEFMLARNAYMLNTGKRIQGEVIAYQFRQSFKPGEVTPEEANQIGYELASKFLRNDHAFIVATHQNTSCVHNHIIVCSTALDCRHKFKNFKNSAQALADLSDQICREHGLSVVTQKHNIGVSYDKWQGRNVKPTQKEKL